MDVLYFLEAENIRGKPVKFDKQFVLKKKEKFFFLIKFFGFFREKV